MSQPNLEPSNSPNTVRIFVIVAVAVLAPLLLFSRLASGAQHTPEAVVSTPGAAPFFEPSSIPLQENEIPLFSQRAEITSPPPDVAAESYVIVDRQCGDLVAEKNAEERLPPASLTKIITAMVVRSHANLDDMVTIKVSGKKMAAAGSSVMGIEPSMRLSVRDLLYGMFLPSGNDAAEALAQYVAGDDQHFSVLMNQTASQLHMNDTHFTNPHGLDEPSLYSTSLDLTEAGLALLADPVLAQISAAPEYKPNWTGDELKNGNQMLKSYPGAFGVKIGFTEKAHQTMVAAAQRDGRQLVVSLLKTDDRYADAQALLDWAFASSRPTC